MLKASALDDKSEQVKTVVLGSGPLIPAPKERRREDQLKVILSSTVSWRLAWAALESLIQSGGRLVTRLAPLPSTSIAGPRFTG